MLHRQLRKGKGSILGLGKFFLEKRLFWATSPFAGVFSFLFFFVWTLNFSSLYIYKNKINIVVTVLRITIPFISQQINEYSSFHHNFYILGILRSLMKKKIEAKCPKPKKKKKFTVSQSSWFYKVF